MKIYKAIILILIVAFQLNAQQKINLVTYGSGASIVEGDNDNVQYIFIKVNPQNKDSLLYVRGFDLDCSSANDLAYGKFNTVTEYSLYGGNGLMQSFDNKAEVSSGLNLANEFLIEKKSISDDSEYDNRWKTLFDLSDQKLTGNSEPVYFILKVAGISGDDANVFNIVQSVSSFDEYPSDNVELYTYVPTLRLEENQEFASIKIDVPRTDKIVVHEFDAGKAKETFNTPFRSVKLNTVSNQGQWVEHSVNLESIEYESTCELVFGQGPEQPNDVTFYFTTGEGNFLPVKLPIEVGKTNRRPVINYSVVKLADCYSAVFDAEKSFDQDGDHLTFEWLFGDGETAKGSRVRHQYKEQMTYQVVLKVSDNSGTVGNSSYKAFNVVINVPPVASAGNDFTTAPGEVVTFDASASTDADGKISRYYWEFGDGAVSEGKVVKHSFNSPGKYNARLIVNDDSDSPCNSSSDDLLVTVNAAPVAVILQTPSSAIGEELIFDAARSYDPDGEVVKYVWDFGNGTVLEGKKVNYAYTAAGKYNVTLSVTDNSGVSNSTDETTIPVLVNFPPTAEAGNDKLIAVDEIVILEGKGSSDKDGRIIDYTWDLGDGSVKSGYSVAHSYSTPGQYKVKLRVKDDSGTKLNDNNDSLVVVVNARPVAEAGEDIRSTFGRVQFNASQSADSDGDIVQYTWDFGDGSTGNGVDPVHIYREAGTYRVNLKVQDNTNTNNNSNQDFLTVYINNRPVADAGPDILTAPGETITFNGANSFDPDGKITEYVWSFETGESMKGEQITKAFDKPGVYNVNLMIKDNSGDDIAIDYDNLVVVVNHKPVALAGDNKILAPGDEVIFDAGSSFDFDGKVDSYRWDFSDGKSFGEKSFTRTFDTPGIYYGYLSIADDANTTNSRAFDTVKVFVNSKPIPQLPEDIFTCSRILYLDATKSADADGDAIKYTWDFGDGTIYENGNYVKHTYTKGGTYPVKLTVNDGRGLANSVATDYMTVKINLPPIANAGADLLTCAGETILFDAGKSVDPENGVMKYHWDFGDGSTADELNPAKVFPKGGVYQVTLTVTDDSDLECNTDTDQMVVKVVESPVANAGEDMIVCANTEVKFDGTASTDFDGVVNQYDWFFGDGGIGGGAKPTYIFKKAGIYNVTLTVTGDENEGCSNSDTDELVVTVIEAPVAEFISLTEVPENVSISFDASESNGNGSNITGYKWDFGDGTTAEGVNVSHSFSKYGKYIVGLIISTDSETECNSASVQQMITINAAPVASAGNDVKTQVNSAVVFNASASNDADGAIKSYLWDFGDGNTQNGIMAYHSYENAGEYVVILTVQDNTTLANNTVYDTVNVVVNSLPEPEIMVADIVCLGDDVKFSALNTNDSDGTITDYSWSLGDGAVKQGKDITHTYSKSGKYSVMLTVRDDSGLENNAVLVSKELIVNSAPVLKTNNSIVTAPGEKFVLDATGSSDADGDNLSVSWVVSDDIVLQGAKTTHSFMEAGNYNILLSIDDNKSSGCSVVSKEVAVHVNSAPVAVIQPVNDVDFGIANNYIKLSAEGSSDKDRDALTYSWKINNEMMLEGKNVVFTYEAPGKYTVELTVSDGKGLSNSKQKVSTTFNVNGK